MSERKALAILSSLLKEAKHLRRVQREIGGSFSTLQAAVKVLSREELIEPISSNKSGQQLSLTTKGRRIASYLDVVGNAVEGKSSKKVPTEASLWILLLLYTLGKIKGSTRLEKLLFLLKERRPNIGDFYSFIPQTYGPYSRTALEDARVLHEQGLVTITDEPIESWDLGDVVIRKDYLLTKEGGVVVKRKMGDILEDSEFKDLVRDLQTYNTMSLTPLLNYIHQEWPQYCRDEETEN
ncbi:MAG: hypothetical protein V3U49_02485 [Nitrososphaerales archaeon]